MSFSGADPDALAAFAAQTIDAAESLRPIDERLATVEALLKRAVPKPPPVHGQVVGFARLGRRTRELGERVGRFGRLLRAALGGPSAKVPMAMQGVLFPGRAGSPPRPVGWDRWTPKDRTAYLRDADPSIRAIRPGNPTAAGAIASTAGKGLVNAVIGEVDGAANTLTFGLAPNLEPAYRDSSGGAAGFGLARLAGTAAVAVGAPHLLGKALPGLGARTAAGFVARRGVDVAAGAATEASLDRHATPTSMIEAGVVGGIVGGALDGVGQAYTAWRIDRIDVPTISHGFDSIEEWQHFSRRIHDSLTTAGYPEAGAAVQGSGATGKSFKTGLPFDFRRLSDLDVAVTGDTLLADARALGVQMRSRGMRTAPVPLWAQWRLGLRTPLKELSAEVGRPVKIMIYESLQEALDHKPSIPLPQK